MFAQVASDRTPSLTNSGSSSSDSLVTPPSPHRPVPIPRKIHTPSFRQKPKGGRLTKTNSIAEQRPLSTYSPRRSLQTILQKSGVFVNLLHYLSPDEFRAITSTCQEFRQLFRYPVLKDAALSRFVPGYRACLHHRDPQQFVDVAVTARDLHLFRKYFTFPALCCHLRLQFSHLGENWSTCVPHAFSGANKRASPFSHGRKDVCEIACLGPSPLAFCASPAVASPQLLLACQRDRGHRMEILCPAWSKGIAIPCPLIVSRIWVGYHGDTGASERETSCKVETYTIRSRLLHSSDDAAKEENHLFRWS